MSDSRRDFGFNRSDWGLDDQDPFSDFESPEQGTNRFAGPVVGAADPFEGLRAQQRADLQRDQLIDPTHSNSNLHRPFESVARPLQQPPSQWGNFPASAYWPSGLTGDQVMTNTVMGGMQEQIDNFSSSSFPLGANRGPSPQRTSYPALPEEEDFQMPAFHYPELDEPRYERFPGLNHPSGNAPTGFGNASTGFPPSSYTTGFGSYGNMGELFAPRESAPAGAPTQDWIGLPDKRPYLPAGYSWSDARCNNCAMRRAVCSAFPRKAKEDKGKRLVKDITSDRITFPCEKCANSKDPKVRATCTWSIMKPSGLPQLYWNGARAIADPNAASRPAPTNKYRTYKNYSVMDSLEAPPWERSQTINQGDQQYNSVSTAVQNAPGPSSQSVTSTRHGMPTSSLFIAPERVAKTVPRYAPRTKGDGKKCTVCIREGEISAAECDVGERFPCTRCREKGQKCVESKEEPESSDSDVPLAPKGFKKLPKGYIKGRITSTLTGSNRAAERERSKSPPTTRSRAAARNRSESPLERKIRAAAARARESSRSPRRTRSRGLIEETSNSLPSRGRAPRRGRSSSPAKERGDSRFRQREELPQKRATRSKGTTAWDKGPANTGDDTGSTIQPCHYCIVSDLICDGTRPCKNCQTIAGICVETVEPYSNSKARSGSTKSKGKGKAGPSKSTIANSNFPGLENIVAFNNSQRDGGTSFNFVQRATNVLQQNFHTEGEVVPFQNTASQWFLTPAFVELRNSDTDDSAAGITIEERPGGRPGPVLPEVKLPPNRAFASDFNFEDRDGCHETLFSPDGFQFRCHVHPTRCCDVMGHEEFCVCGQCKTNQDRSFLVDRRPQGRPSQDQVTNDTRSYFCKDCANAARQEFENNPDSGIATFNCECTVQMVRAWLCNRHREQAIDLVRRRTLLMKDSITRTKGEKSILCNRCEKNPPDALFGAWDCLACGETVVV